MKHPENPPTREERKISASNRTIPGRAVRKKADFPAAKVRLFRFMLQMYQAPEDMNIQKTVEDPVAVPAIPDHNSVGNAPVTPVSPSEPAAQT